jgi:DNA-binding response OmpR family regulator
MTPREPSDARPARQPSALVVEAEPAVREALAAALAARGFEVASAADGESAVRRMSDDVEGFDLLLAGPAAARADGDLLVRTVRRGGEQELAVVLVTTGGAPSAPLERAGADAVLDGSLGAGIIARASEAVLSRKRARRSA